MSVLLRTLLAMALLAGLAMPASAVLVTPLNDSTVSVTATTRGETRQAALENAKKTAVLASAGRVLLDDVLLRADHLLERYLENYADNFVSGVEILRDEFTGGLTELDARVFIDYAMLVEDMREKRFIYDPAFRPQFAVFLDDRLDGDRIDASSAIVRNQMTIRGLKPYEGAIDSPPLNVNLLDDPLLLEQALVSAERRNIEILFTGEATTTLREERKLYYDIFAFYDCEMTVNMIRVDTGEVLATSSATGSASARDRREAITTAITRATETIGNDLIGSYRAFWPDVVQAQADYKLLVTGADEELLNIIRQQLQILAPETDLDVRKTFDQSAILTIRTPSSREQVIEAIQSCPFPTLRIVREVGDNKFEIQVSG